MSEISRSSEAGEARKAEKLGETGKTAKRRRRAQTALLAAALGFAPFAAFAQTTSPRSGNGLTGKFSIAGSVESAPSEEKSAPTPTASRAEFKAFLVGADDYDDVPKLTCVKNDVEAFAARLIEIGVDKNNVTVLKTGGKRRDDPTKANIENRFNDFVESLGPGDFAVVFMSGHGLQNKETKEAFFAPVDLAPEELFETAVSIDGMLARLEKSRAKCRWMIVDACRNVPASWGTSEMRTRAVDGAAPGLTSLIEVPDSTILLQSCEPGEVSYEGGEGSEHGLFTQSLLEALDKNGSKADGNSDGVLKLTELVEYVAERTNELATQNGGTQKPTWSGATTDFEILTTLIEGLPPARWREADALYQEACVLRRKREYRQAAAKLSEARKINAVNEDYQAAEAELAAILDFQTQAQEATTAQAEANKLAEDAWTAFNKGGIANVREAVALTKKSLELVDSAPTRNALALFEKTLKELQTPKPPTVTPPQPPQRVAQNGGSTSGSSWNRAERVAADASDSGTSGRTSSGTSSTSLTSGHASALAAADASGRQTPNSGSPSGSVSSTGTSSTSSDWTGTHTAGTQKTLNIKGATYNFRYCPAGTFTMGSPESEAERFSWETQHEVKLTQGFWMLETEVTQALWESVTGENPITVSSWKGPKKPVGNVSWEDCQEFIEKLNSLGIAPAGLKFRLPTEAEWEYACRAGTSGPYAGSGLDAMGWYKDNSDGDNHDVGEKAPNAWGLYDMHGNVEEWCSDWFDAAPYDAASQTDPTGPWSGSDRVLRGGSWNINAKYCRSAYRFSLDPTNRLSRFGFRLVLGR